MSDAVKTTQADLDISRMGVMIQFESLFDQETRTQLDQLGMQKFLNYVVQQRAHSLALIRHYSNFMHPKEKT